VSFISDRHGKYPAGETLSSIDGMEEHRIKMPILQMGKECHRGVSGPQQVARKIKKMMTFS
jgi:hypothetical protein